MRNKQISEKSEFNKKAGHPLQSWEWGEFREKAGNEVVRFSFGQVTLHKIPGTKYKVGAFIKGSMPTQEMIDELKDFAKRENLIFIKLEPNYVIKKGDITCADEEKVVSMLKKSGAVPGKTLFTPTTFWIDLRPSEEELLKSFHPKTRYNIRYAQRKGVKVEVVEDPTSRLLRRSGYEGRARLRGASNSDKAFDKYIELTRETVERQGFYAHSEKYHRLMWKVLRQSLITSHQSPIARLLTATYEKEIITTWIVFVWHDFLYYPYGASTEKYKNVMANNLMMWEAIRYGKALGLSTFDLWGREEGKGFTKFKEGYNPKVVEFLGTWDLVINPTLYRIYRLAESSRWSILRTTAKLGLSKNKF